MGLADTFGAEDRVQVKFSDFYKLMKQATQYEIAMNAVGCDVPHRYIRESLFYLEAMRKVKKYEPRVEITDIVFQHEQGKMIPHIYFKRKEASG